MESRNLLYCAIAAVLGIISAAMGFAGEATRVKLSEIYIETDTYTCVYPSSPALALGIVAAVFAIITRIYISVSFGGGCCRSGPNSTPISKLFFVLSWVASVGAVLLLLAAAGLNNRESGQIDSYDTTCYVVKPGIFAAGAILALASAGLGIVAFIVTLSSATDTTTHPSIGLPAAHANVDPEKYPQQHTPQQYTQQQYPPQQQYTQQQQYPPQQYPQQQYTQQQQYPPQQYPPQQYPPQQ